MLGKYPKRIFMMCWSVSRRRRSLAEFFPEILVPLTTKPFILSGIDNTASYFGDVNLEPGDIDSVVEAVFDGVHGLIARERKWEL